MFLANYTEFPCNFVSLIFRFSMRFVRVLFLCILCEFSTAVSAHFLVRTTAFFDLFYLEFHVKTKYMTVNQAAWAAAGVDLSAAVSRLKMPEKPFSFAARYSHHRLFKHPS